MSEDKTIVTVAVLGGTGQEGAGLAMRWAVSGYNVIIGSRSAERGAQKAAELNGRLGGDYLKGMGNVEAAQQANLVVLSVPYAAHKATLTAVKEAIQGKILIDVTVATKDGHKREVHLPPGLSSALEVQEFLGEGVQVVAAFQNVGAAHLRDHEQAIDCDVLVCGDDKNAKAEVIKLVEAAGMRGFDAGKLRNAIAVEALTPVLIQLSVRYKIKGAGIRITGLDQ